MTPAQERVLRRAAYQAPAPIFREWNEHGGSRVKLHSGAIAACVRRGWLTEPDSTSLPGYWLTLGGRDALMAHLLEKP